ncbi:MAG: hypothetical protein PVI40_05385 [Chlamydiota bacterium]|jgi:hypothetical protein
MDTVTEVLTPRAVVDSLLDQNEYLFDFSEESSLTSSDAESIKSENNEQINATLQLRRVDEDLLMSSYLALPMGTPADIVYAHAKEFLYDCSEKTALIVIRCLQNLDREQIEKVCSKFPVSTPDDLFFHPSIQEVASHRKPEDVKKYVALVKKELPVKDKTHLVQAYLDFPLGTSAKVIYSFAKESMKVLSKEDAIAYLNGIIQKNHAKFEHLCQENPLSSPEKILELPEAKIFEKHLDIDISIRNMQQTQLTSRDDRNDLKGSIEYLEETDKAALSDAYKKSPTANSAKEVYEAVKDSIDYVSKKEAIEYLNLNFFAERDKSYLLKVYKKLPIDVSAEQVYKAIKKSISSLTKEEAIAFINSKREASIERLRLICANYPSLPIGEFLLLPAMQEFAAHKNIQELVDLIQEEAISKLNPKKRRIIEEERSRSKNTDREFIQFIADINPTGSSEDIYAECNGSISLSEKEARKYIDALTAKRAAKKEKLVAKEKSFLVKQFSKMPLGTPAKNIYNRISHRISAFPQEEAIKYVNEMIQSNEEQLAIICRSNPNLNADQILKLPEASKFALFPDIKNHKVFSSDASSVESDAASVASDATSVNKVLRGAFYQHPVGTTISKIITALKDQISNKKEARQFLKALKADEDALLTRICKENWHLSEEEILKLKGAKEIARHLASPETLKGIFQAKNEALLALSLAEFDDNFIKLSPAHIRLYLDEHGLGSDADFIDRLAKMEQDLRSITDIIRTFPDISDREIEEQLDFKTLKSYSKDTLVYAISYSRQRIALTQRAKRRTSQERQRETMLRISLEGLV